MVQNPQIRPPLELGQRNPFLNNVLVHPLDEINGYNAEMRLEKQQVHPAVAQDVIYGPANLDIFSPFVYPGPKIQKPYNSSPAYGEGLDTGYGLPKYSNDSFINSRNSLVLPSYSSYETWELPKIDISSAQQIQPPHDLNKEIYELYHNAAPQLDGLYHCPWEGQQDVCQHRPEKIKGNYE